MVRLCDAKKAGTLIISHYRSGSHFLQSVVKSHCSLEGIPCVALGEKIKFEDNKRVLLPEVSSYLIGILNSPMEKSRVFRCSALLDRYFKVRLIHDNIQRHFLSTILWWRNNMLTHHDTLFSEIPPKTVCDISQVKRWKMEQTINDKVYCDSSVCYSDLASIGDAVGIPWTPNDYAFSLHDIFVNATEVIEELEK